MEREGRAVSEGRGGRSPREGPGEGKGGPARPGPRPAARPRPRPRLAGQARSRQGEAGGAAAGPLPAPGGCWPTWLRGGAAAAGVGRGGAAGGGDGFVRERARRGAAAWRTPTRPRRLPGWGDALARSPLLSFRPASMAQARRLAPTRAPRASRGTARAPRSQAQWRGGAGAAHAGREEDRHSAPSWMGGGARAARRGALIKGHAHHEGMHFAGPEAANPKPCGRHPSHVQRFITL